MASIRGATLRPPRSTPDRARVLAASAALDGWLAPAEAEALFDLALHGESDGAVVEIGSFVGKSLVCLAGAARLRAVGSRVVSIDPHEGSPEHQPGEPGFQDGYWCAAERRVNTLPALRRNLRAARLADAVEVVAATSDAASATWSDPIRLLFVDGDHDYRQVTRDLRNWTRWVCAGGVVAIHDYAARAWPGVSRAVDEWLGREPDFQPVCLAGEMLVVQHRVPAHTPPGRVDDALAAEWGRALVGDVDARGRWRVEEGGTWGWDGAGIRLAGDGSEWAAFVWDALPSDTLAGLGAFAVEVTVRGSADAAGLSFGPYRDFLAELEPDVGPRRLRLEVHPDGLWAFEVDGVRQPRRWWDGGLQAGETPCGTLSLKARIPEAVAFHDLRVTRLTAAPCRVSVVLTCHRFVQRLRVALRGWCAQPLPLGALEVLVANPDSPDGTREHLAAVADSHPHLRVREVRAPAALATHKGALINRALDVSRGDWVWLSDADCLFAPDVVDRAMASLREGDLGYCERRYLGPEQTRALLAGRTDPVADFHELARATGPRTPHREAWGYCQIVHRATAERVRYAVRRHFAESDLLFVQDCERLGVHPVRVPGLLCLHLDHPFAWYGTREFL